MRQGWAPAAFATLLVGALMALLFMAGPASAATCADYDNQADAQRAADTRDGDGDGIYCESLPCPCLKPGQGGGGSDPEPKPSCRREDREFKVKLPDGKYPNIADHITDAKHAGKSRHLVLDRPGAKKRREAALKGIPTKEGFDRDEYPPAVSRQGGKGADVRYVPSSENRSAGSSMGSQLKPYCNGQRFRIITP